MVVTLVSAASVTFQRESHACVPPPPTSATEELQRWSTVFAGRVVEVYSLDHGMMYEFRVDTVWKGPLLETVFVFSGNDTSSCASMRFDIRRDYIVYEGNGLIGSRTGLLASAHEDLTELGEGQRPVPGTSETRPRSIDEPTFPMLPIVVIGVALVALLIASVVPIPLQRSGGD